MRRVLIPVIVFALTATAVSAQEVPLAEDLAGVNAALQHYLNGHATGDPEEFRKAFHPDARMTFVRDGMTLLKDNGRWVIIAKSFNSAPKSR